MLIHRHTSTWYLRLFIDLDLKVEYLLHFSYYIFNWHLDKKKIVYNFISCYKNSSCVKWFYSENDFTLERTEPKWKINKYSKSLNRIFKLVSGKWIFTVSAALYKF